MFIGIIGIELDTVRLLSNKYCCQNAETNMSLYCKMEVLFNCKVTKE